MVSDTNSDKMGKRKNVHIYLHMFLVYNHSNQDPILVKVKLMCHLAAYQGEKNKNCFGNLALKCQFNFLANLDNVKNFVVFFYYFPQLITNYSLHALELYNHSTKRI